MSMVQYRCELVCYVKFQIKAIRGIKQMTGTREIVANPHESTAYPTAA